MSDAFLNGMLSYGPFATLFTYLLWWVLKENAKREEKYQEIISNLTARFSLLEKVQVELCRIGSDVTEIKTTTGGR